MEDVGSRRRLPAGGGDQLYYFLLDARQIDGPFEIRGDMSLQCFQRGVRLVRD